jgi:hypothetical protein
LCFAADAGFASLSSPFISFLVVDMETQQKTIEEPAEDDAARREADERDRKRRERVQEALLRWSKAPKKQGRFQR